MTRGSRKRERIVELKATISRYQQEERRLRERIAMLEATTWRQRDALQKALDHWVKTGEDPIDILLEALK